MADRNLRVLKDIVDQICVEEKQCGKDTPITKEFEKLAKYINTMLQKNEICFDNIYGSVDSQLATIEETLETQPELKTFNIKLFLEAYIKWEKNVMSDRLTALTMGESSKPLVNKELIDFDDITGMKREKEEIKTQFIYPYEYPKLFPNKSRGMLLYGPPGTGKTYLVKALANELQNTILFTPSPSEFKGKYEGETEKKITALYAEATNILNGPPKYDTNGDKIPTPKSAVIFIDEADSLFGAGREEDSSKQRTVNTFLQLMDGINTDKRIATIAATNYPKSLDEAILRRLQVKIFINLPTNDMRLFQLVRSLSNRYSWPANENNFWENIKTYGYGKYTYTNSRLWGSTYNYTAYHLTPENLVRVLQLTTNNPSNSDYFENVGGKARGIDDYEYDITSIAEGHADSLSPLGYTLSDLNNALNKAYDMASLRAVSEDAYFIKHGSGADQVYIYCPTYTNLADDEDLIEEFNKKHNYDIVSADEIDDNSKKITFDIRLDDIVEALKKTPATAKLESYKDIYSYYKQTPE